MELTILKVYTTDNYRCFSKFGEFEFGSEYNIFKSRVRGVNANVN